MKIFISVVDRWFHSLVFGFIPLFFNLVPVVSAKFIPALIWHVQDPHSVVVVVLCAPVIGLIAFLELVLIIFVL